MDQMVDEVGLYLFLRNQQDAEWRQESSQCPSSAIIPSPEKLDKSRYFPGQDVTKTLKDFKTVWSWLTSRQFSNPLLYAPIIRYWNLTGNMQLEPVQYNSLVHMAFGFAFDKIRYTFDREQHEIVLLYYTGHGCAPPLPWQTEQGTLPSSRPEFERMFGRNNAVYNYRQIERRFNWSRHRRVRGGELCLHGFGYCDLKGLLTPWIAALQTDYIRSNKHLVIILDSCYSGKFVDDLEQLKHTPGPWNENGCSVTVQSGCGSRETIRGGIFTPCFIKLMERPGYINHLEYQWSRLSPWEKDCYRRLNLPSPRVSTTMQINPPLSQHTPTITLPTIQNLTLTLFQDAAFFKFCFTKVCREQFYH